MINCFFSAGSHHSQGRHKACPVSRVCLPALFSLSIISFLHFMSDIDDIIAGGGIVFRKAKTDNGNDGKVKTKAKKKKYITGAHGSGSARQKAKYREARANRKHK